MIGVVGDGDEAAHVAAAVDAAGIDATVATAQRLDESGAAALVAVGEDALLDAVAAGVVEPILAAGLGDGLPSVPVDAVPSAVGAYLDGTVGTSPHRLLAVEVDGEPAGRAVFDTMLVRGEPGRISEYSLAAGAARARFRADGVVVATPAGSHGYAHAAGGPRLGLDADVVVVVPVAAFGLGTPTWVLDPVGGLRLRVERDEGDVSLLVDGRPTRRLSGQASLTLRPGGELSVIDPPTE